MEAEQQNLSDIRTALVQIEAKIDRDKWQPLIVGLIVAVITAIATVIGTIVTNRKQEQVRQEVTQSVEKLGEMGKQVAQKQMDFYVRANTLLNDVDDSFNALCYLSPTVKAEQQLTDALDAYRKLLEQTTEEITGTNLRFEMKKYSDYIIGKFSLIKQSGRQIDGKEKDHYYRESRKLQDSLKQQLNKVLSRT